MFCFPDWINKDILNVKALIKEDGTFKSLNEIITEYKFNPKPLDYFGCVSSVKEYMTTHSIVLNSNAGQKESQVASLLTNEQKGTKPIYNVLLGNKETPTVCRKWDTILGTQINWEKAFLQINSIKETKLKWFQLKICYRILVTNTMLSYMNVSDSNKCSFCLTEKDTILHYLWECNHVQIFWNNFVQFLKEKCVHCDRLYLNATIVLFGKDKHTRTDACFDEILLNAKFFIYKCRLNKVKPNTQVFFNNDIKLLYKIDKYLHYQEMQIDKFYKKWRLYTEIVN